MHAGPETVGGGGGLEVDGDAGEVAGERMITSFVQSGLV